MELELAAAAAAGRSSSSDSGVVETRCFFVPLKLLGAALEGADFRFPSLVEACFGIIAVLYGGRFWRKMCDSATEGKARFSIVVGGRVTPSSSSWRRTTQATPISDDAAANDRNARA